MIDKLVSAPIDTLKGISQLPFTRQIMVLIGLALSIAIGCTVVLWSKEPNYRPLYTHVTPQESSEILDALQQSNIDFKVDTNSGSIMVPVEQLYDARFKIASKGILKTPGVGFELLDNDQGFGLSRFMETNRFRRALEGELARTIMGMSNIKSARVHLAIPKDSVFINDHHTPSASVFVELKSGMKPDSNQVSAIVQLVASSIQNMSPKDVSVVNQHGELLTDNSSEDSIYKKSLEQLQYQNRIEKEYSKRIENILSPFFGAQNVRATVSADLDFNQSEQTQENYEPNPNALRSEQYSREQNAKDNSASGIPGMLSNQAPQNQSNPPNPANPEGSQPNSASGKTTESSPAKEQGTKNYELNKVLSYSKAATGQIKRLSIAVAIGNHTITDPKTGQVSSKPLTPEEITKITDLVKKTIGYDEKRNDSVSIVNAPFVVQLEGEDLTALPWWEAPWVWYLIKMIGAAIFILIILFGLIRPMISALANKGRNELVPHEPSFEQGYADPMYDRGVTFNPEQKQWDNLKEIVAQDPKKIAQVLKNWVGTEK